MGLGRSPAVMITCEMISTIIEQMGVVYMFIPMLPYLGAGKVRAKTHHETEAPVLHEVCMVPNSMADLR